MPCCLLCALQEKLSVQDGSCVANQAEMLKKKKNPTQVAHLLTHHYTCTWLCPVFLEKPICTLAQGMLLFPWLSSTAYIKSHFTTWTWSMNCGLQSTWKINESRLSKCFPASSDPSFPRRIVAGTWVQVSCRQSLSASSEHTCSLFLHQRLSHLSLPTLVK